MKVDTSTFTASHGSVLKIETLTLNINPIAVSNFQMVDEGFQFICRMGGLPVTIFASYESVITMFCPDTDLKQDFSIDASLLSVIGIASLENEPQAPIKDKIVPKITRDRSHLQVIK